MFQNVAYRPTVYRIGTRIMTSNVVRICVLLALFSKIFCQSHLTQQDWDLASTINFRELAEYYQANNITVELRESEYNGVQILSQMMFSKGVSRILLYLL